MIWIFISLYDREVRLLWISGYYVDIGLCNPYQAKHTNVNTNGTPYTVCIIYIIMYIYSDWCASTELLYIL